MFTSINFLCTFSLQTLLARCIMASKRSSGLTHHKLDFSEGMYHIWTVVLLHVITQWSVSRNTWSRLLFQGGNNKASSQRWLNRLSACFNIYRTSKRTFRIRRDAIFGTFKDMSVLPDTHKNNYIWTCPGLSAIQTTCDAKADIHLLHPRHQEDIKYVIINDLNI